MTLPRVDSPDAGFFDRRATLGDAPPAQPRPRPNINVQIEHLILDGLPLTRAQGALVQAALEAELNRLLTEGGITGSFREGGVVPSLRADAVHIASLSPAQLGAQIARAVYGQFRGGEQ